MHIRRMLLTAVATGLLISPAAAELSVVVTIKPIHSIVAAVMAGVGEPRLLVQGAASPHTYALKPSDAAAIDKADVVFRVSEGLEPFTRKVFRGLRKTTRGVTLQDTPGLTLLDVREGGAFEDHAHGKGHDHGHKHKHGKGGKDDDVDGHIWLDPDNAKRIADAVAAILAERSPQDADRLKANATALRGRIDALDAELAQSLAAVKDRPFVVFHDAYQYFERRYGLRAVGSITVNPEVPPSARRLTQLRDKIRSLSAVCVMREPQFDPKVVTSIVDGTNARVGELDPEGAALTPGPDLYPAVMRNLAASLRQCLGGVS